MSNQRSRKCNHRCDRERGRAGTAVREFQTWRSDLFRFSTIHYPQSVHFRSLRLVVAHAPYRFDNVRLRFSCLARTAPPFRRPARPHGTCTRPSLQTGSSLSHLLDCRVSSRPRPVTRSSPYSSPALPASGKTRLSS